MLKLKRLLSMILFISIGFEMLFGFTVFTSSAASTAGSGTTSNPYVITSASQLATIGGSGYYTLESDIDLSAYPSWTGIGSQSYPFTGTFDGNGHKITGLELPGNGEDFGLFGYVQNATIKNVKVSINGSEPAQNGTLENTGALVGYAIQSTITGCSASGSIGNGSGQFTGGLIGTISGGTLSNCYSNVSVDDGYNIGGLVGEIGSNATITSSTAAGAVTGGYEAGGFVGLAYGGTISNCDATGNITASSDSGGFIGYVEPGAQLNISTSFATGNVKTSGNDAGGFIGYITGAGVNSESNTVTHITNCYATGSVSGHSLNYSDYDPQSHVGGFIGEVVNFDDDLEVTNSYAAGVPTSDDGYMGEFSSYYSGSVQYNGITEAMTDVYVDFQSCDNVAENIGNGGVAGINEMSTANMESQSFANTLNNNIAKLGLTGSWGQSPTANNGYPYLVGVGADTTPPTGSYTLSKSTWTCNPVTIYVTATDDDSGVASITEPNGTVVNGSTASYVVTSNGTYTFTLTDNAGNQGSYAVTVSNIDRSISVTHPLSISYTYDPNTGTLTVPNITLQNGNHHVGVSVTLAALNTAGMNDVAPDKYTNWDALTSAQTASDMSFSIGVKELSPSAGGWASIADSSPIYSSTLTSPVKLGVLSAGGSGNLAINTKFGLAWSNTGTVTHNIALIFDVCDVN